MELIKTFIDDLYVIRRPIRQDSRGFFTRLYGVDEMAACGRPTEAAHVNTSTSVAKGTLRGIHFQYPPYAEAKIVSCTAGAIWDVGIDLRPNSKTQFRWFGEKLTPDNGLSLLIPEGFGHAFITLEPSSTVVYVVSSIYALDHESGLRFDDPILDINWPLEPTTLSDKDLSWGLLQDRVEEISSRLRLLG